MTADHVDVGPELSSRRLSSSRDAAVQLFGSPISSGPPRTALMQKIHPRCGWKLPARRERSSSVPSGCLSRSWSISLSRRSRYKTSGGETEVLGDFEKTAEEESTSRTLKTSLLHLQEEFGLSANDLLPEREASYKHWQYFNGWDYLEEYLMGTPVWKQKIKEAHRKWREFKKKQQQKRTF
jgi:hypothetical protein